MLLVFDAVIVIADVAAVTVVVVVDVDVAVVVVVVVVAKTDRRRDPVSSQLRATSGVRREPAENNRDFSPIQFRTSLNEVPPFSARPFKLKK